MAGMTNGRGKPGHYYRRPEDAMMYTELAYEALKRVVEKVQEE
jgi:hypothetical protein